MRVQKTAPRSGRTLAHGMFQARETVHVCAGRCRHPAGMLVTQRTESLRKQIIPNGIVGYDVMVYVGLQRFLHHRQREEIRTALEDRYDITLSTGEISALAVRFLNYLEALHEARSTGIRNALVADGGWPMHVDATGEDGRGTLLVVFAGWRRWVLGSWKIPTERADAILPRLHSVRERFGDPCAVMRDMGRAMRPAVADFLEEAKLEIPALSCHQHFLADIGEDLLETSYGKLRQAFRQSKVRPGLRALARDLGRKLSGSLAEARQAVVDWQQQAEGGHVLPNGRDGLAVIRAMTQWVLDYPADSTYGGSFPFDRPYLDLYDRCCRARRAADAFRRRLPDDRSLRRSLDRFCRVLDATISSDSCRRPVATLRARAALFDELRDTLRIDPRHTRHDNTVAGLHPAPEETIGELRDIEAALEEWASSLRKRRPARGPAEDVREAIDIILAHLERHGDSLWGHVINLPSEAGGGTRLTDRTNYILENFFKYMKHHERRRSGRKILTQDLEHLPPAAALARNLLCPDYVEIVCGTLDKLPAAFAELDAERLKAKRAGLPPPHSSGEATQAEDVVSASLPTADRRIVRSEGMDKRMERAAKSRAPRTGRRAG